MFHFRFVATAASIILSAAFAAAPTAAESGFTEREAEEVRKIIREYLINNPEVIVDAIQEMRRLQQVAKLAASRKAIRENKAALLHNGLDPVGGNRNGSVTLIEFFDYNCGWCKRNLPHIKAAIKADGDVRVVYKEFPILSSSSRTATQAALAAHKQGKYQEMHDQLMAFRGPLDEPRIMAIAKKVGLDVKKLTTDMQSSEIKARITANLTLAQKLDIQGTPAFIVGGKLIPSFMRTAQLVQEFKRTRKECAEKKISFC